MVTHKNEVLSGEVMNINKENFIETTTKFNELRKELNKNFYRKQDYASDEHFKCLALKDTVEKMLILLDEMVRS